VVGLITERQLTLDGRYLRLASTKVPRIHGRWVTALEEVQAACIAARTVTAGELMERHFTSVCVDEPVGAAIDRLQRRDADYAVVRDGSRVVGMLSGRDLLRQFASQSHARVQQNDREPIRLSAHNGHVSFIDWLVGSRSSS
jgi:CBS domain-containing protein